MQQELKRLMKVVDLISKPFIKMYAQPLKILFNKTNEFTVQVKILKYTNIDSIELDEPQSKINHHLPHYCHCFLNIYHVQIPC